MPEPRFNAIDLTERRPPVWLEEATMPRPRRALPPPIPTRRPPPRAVLPPLRISAPLLAPIAPIPTIAKPPILEDLGDTWFETTRDIERTTRGPRWIVFARWLVASVVVVGIVAVTFVIAHRVVSAPPKPVAKPSAVPAPSPTPPPPPPVITPPPPPPEVAPPVATPPAHRAVRRTPVSTRGKGMLMVSTKPPCEVAIDGVATVLTTPHKFELAAGKHTITLFDVGRHIKATIPVVIAPRKTTKLVRDFLAESAP